MMMQTTEANTNNNNNTDALLTSGGCARLLVAARLPLLSSSEEEELPLTFEELNAALRQRPLLAAADRLFPALVAAAEACHGALERPPVCHTRTLLTACMIEGHPINVFEFPTEPLEAALSAATAPFLRTFGRLVAAVAATPPTAPTTTAASTTTQEEEEELPPFGLTTTTIATAAVEDAVVAPKSAVSFVQEMSSQM
jgi:hypothetical protein